MCAIIKVQQGKEDKEMMTMITINRQWFDEVKKMVSVVDPFFYTENGREMVECLVYEPAFNKASEQLGWIA